MGLSSALQWWDEWQLRVLVLGSLIVQFLLFISAPFRKFAIPSWYRFLAWLAYLGSDALAIYALATLFNRQRKQDCSSAHSSSALEVVWAPVLLMHLGGQDHITAYNIEDNELWGRHLVTAVSQVTVAIYVFCKSWPGGDKRLLQVAILFFVPGVLKCIEKPWALKSASINSLVSSSGPALRTTNRDGEINSLEDYVREARAFVWDNGHPQAQGDDAQGEEAQGDDAQGEEAQGDAVVREPYELFVDLASPYHNRLSTLKSFWILGEKKAYHLLQQGLSNTFDLLYTKEKMVQHAFAASRSHSQPSASLTTVIGLWIRVISMYLPVVAVGLWNESHKEAYNDSDVMITYALFCCTAVLECYSITTSLFVRNKRRLRSALTLPGLPVSKIFGMVAQSSLIGFFVRNKRFHAPKTFGMVAQYSLTGFFVRNKRNKEMMCVVSCFKCKDYLDQQWCMKPCSSSRRITELVLRHVKAGWREYIEDTASYRMFNDHRGQWTLQHHQCDPDLGWSLKRPFDESVLLWHIATDFCFYDTGASLDHTCATARRGEPSGDECAPWCEIHGSAIRCREMSNYMMYLLFVNPEMLMAGARRNMFTTAYDELVKILEGEETPLEEGGLTQEIIAMVQSPLPEGCQEGFIHDAWTLARALLALDLRDENRMWKVIEGVWVEMLCFSAGRCRGYLHAKGLGAGGEFLSYVWLLLSHMGMEALAERLQRMKEAEVPSAGGNAGAAPSASQVSATGADNV